MLTNIKQWSKKKFFFDLVLLFLVLLLYCSNKIIFLLFIMYICKIVSSICNKEKINIYGSLAKWSLVKRLSAKWPYRWNDYIGEMNVSETFVGEMTLSVKCLSVKWTSAKRMSVKWMRPFLLYRVRISLRLISKI